MCTINCKGNLISLQHPIVMGIINTTPDSFYTLSRQNTIAAALQKAEQMLVDGSTIIDIGGQSTKPNSTPISEQEELQRVIPIIQAICHKLPQAIISIDTYFANVAKQAIAAGASIVNDISAGNLDNEMITTVAQLKVPYICMHMQGTPSNMQQNPIYENVTKQVIEFFIEKIHTCTKAGIMDIIVDIGFGFGKNIQHNFRLLKELQAFSMLQKPILVGVSRKSTIYNTLQITPNEALNGTTVLNTIALLNGAKILRVHDVKEAMECIKLHNAYNKS